MTRKFVYREALTATRVDRGKILDMWMEMGTEPSKTEDKELSNELVRLRRKGAHASALAKSVIASADDRVRFIEMLDTADADGLQVVQAGEEDEDDDEEDEEE